MWLHLKRDSCEFNRDIILKLSNLWFLLRLQEAGSIIKNLEAVIEKFVEQFAKSLKSRRYAKIDKTCKKTSKIVSRF